MSDIYELAEQVQKYISREYSSVLIDKSDEKKTRIKSYIKKYVSNQKSVIPGFNESELIDRIYDELVEFSFITKFLKSEEVEEVNINSWNDIKVTYSNGSVIPSGENFKSPSHARDVIKRLLHQSGMILDNAQPAVVGHLSNKIRVTVLGSPLTDGISASIRIINPKKLGRDELLRNGTATKEMLDFLEVCLKYGVSICFSGATGSGKTTLMSWLLSTIPNEKRIFTIENDCREFNLVKYDEVGNVVNNVVHTVTRYSDDVRQNIDQEKLLEYALTFNPDIICVGEMKSAEAFAAQEASRTGHAVVTTTHANSCVSTYNRMVTLCTQKYDLNDKTLFNLVTEAFPIVVYTKQLDDKSRRCMEITECTIDEEGNRKIVTLYRFDVVSNEVINGKTVIKGSFEKVSPISNRLKKRLLDNGVPKSVLEGGF